MLILKLKSDHPLMPIPERLTLIQRFKEAVRRHRPREHIRQRIVEDTFARLRAENEDAATARLRADTQFMWGVVIATVAFEIAMGAAAWWFLT